MSHLNVRLFSRGEEKYAFLASLFVLSLGIANVIASKVIDIFGFAAPAGIIVYPVTFLVTDIVAEVYGKEKAQRVVWTGFFLMLFLLGMLKIALLLPPAPFYKDQDAFQKIFGLSSRIVTASLIAYLVSQTSDVTLFHFWRGVTKTRHLWIRNNLSTMTSQIVDTVLFILIAFYGIYPLRDCLHLIGGQYLFKFAFALLDTPFVYLGVWWAKRGESDKR